MAISNVLNSFLVFLPKPALSSALHPEHMHCGERRDASAFAFKEPLSSATLAKLLKLLVDRRFVHREFSDSIPRPLCRSPSSMTIQSNFNGIFRLVGIDEVHKLLLITSLELCSLR